MSSRFAERRRKRLVYVLGAIAGVLVLLFLLLWWFFNASFLKITSVEVSGENVIPQSSIMDVVNNDISGSYLGVFARSNILLYPKSGIMRNLQALYPTLEDVSISAKDFHTIDITVHERKPYALWCGNDPSNPGNCFLLDTDGLAYANAPQYSREVYQTYFSSLPTTSLPEQFLTPSLFHSLSALVGAFQTKIASDTVESIVVDDSSDVHLAFSGGYELLFALTDDTGQVFNRFSLALTAEPLLSHRLSDFQYIDMRFGDKVYYKPKKQ